MAWLRLLARQSFTVLNAAPVPRLCSFLCARKRLILLRNDVQQGLVGSTAFPRCAELMVLLANPSGLREQPFPIKTMHLLHVDESGSVGILRSDFPARRSVGI